MKDYHAPKHVDIDELKKTFRFIDADNGDYRLQRLLSNKEWKLLDNTKFCNHGYVRARFKVRMIKYHNIVFALYNGYWPEKPIDHEDNDKLNNHPLNLREVSHRENILNSSSSSRNKTGITGVSWNKCAKKYQAKTQIDGKLKYLGLFDNKTEAGIEVYRSMVKAGQHHKNVIDRVFVEVALANY